MKLRKLHIENYKMFKDFDISFLDKDDNPLKIVVLAGVNGSGKTTLLEFIPECNGHESNIDLKLVYEDGPIDTDFIEITEGKNQKIKKLSPNIRVEPVDVGLTYNIVNVELNEHKDIILFPAGIDDTKKVAGEFVKTFYDFLKNKDYRPSEVKEHFDTYMKDIFKGLDLTFNYSRLDKEDNVWFTNNSGEEFQIEQLSTGEKTLLSKILYIYFKDYQDKVILIDEPELSLHPSWQNKILSVYERLAEKNNCQIIIATHSPHIIGSAKPEYLRILKKEEDGIKVLTFNQSYGLKFSQILTDIMDADYLRTPEVAKKMDDVKALIVSNQFDTEEFSQKWTELESILGKEYLDLKLLKLDIASRKKNA